MDSSSYKKAVRRVEALESLIKNNVLTTSPTLNERLRKYYKKEQVTTLIRAAREEVRGASNLVFKDELKYRRRVLRRLG
mgnify:CR=1 FL=1